MNLLPNSGKFWLKFLIFSIIAVIATAAGLYASVYNFFTPKRIETLTQSALQSTQRTIRFSPEIQRSWFPRPTLTLKNVVISYPNSTQAAIHIKETNIGIGWSSLWNETPIIEKWVLKGADVSIERTENGKWSLQDLWQQPRNTATLNRLVVENSTLRLKLDNTPYTIEDFSLNLRSEDSDGRRFKINGNIRNPQFPLEWNGNGLLKINAANWSIPELRFEAQSRRDQDTVKINITSALDWQTQNHTLQVNNINLRAESVQRNLHLTAQAPLLIFKDNHLNLNTVSGAFTAGSSDGQWDGSFKLDKTNLRPSVITLDSFELNGRYKNQLRQTSFTVSGPMLWQKKTGLQSDNVRITTLQDTVNRLPQTRFISLLDVNFSLTDFVNWLGRFKGTFDRQPVALSLKYQTQAEQKPTLEAGVALQKLNLTPYLEDFQAGSDDPYPKFLNRTNTPDIIASIKVNNIQTPGFQLDNVETRLTANNEHITLSNFKAGLYGGRTEGGISIANTNPLSYHLQQNAESVQIQPLLQDLFGFHSFSGNGNAVIDLTTKGNNREQLLKNLNGMLTLNISEGAWHGIDMDNILKNGIISKDNTNQTPPPKTPFHHFVLNSEIDKGISRHVNTELFSDSLHVVSSGYTNLSTQELSEDLLIRNALNPQNKPIPLKIRGTVQNPSITIDYNRLTDGLNSPQEKQKALENTLREQWQWINPNRK